MYRMYQIKVPILILINYMNCLVVSKYSEWSETAAMYLFKIWSNLAHFLLLFRCFTQTTISFLIIHQQQKHFMITHAISP